MHTTAAKVFGACYYLSLAWLLLWVSAAVMIALAVTSGTGGSSGSLLSNAAMGFGLFVLALAIGGAPPLLFYGLVVSVDRAPPAAPVRPTPDR
ncbi:MAG: hypothetical protein ACRDQW_14510 [Haloechinothrix sp.]